MGCCHRGGKEDRISLMNTRGVLINKQRGTSYSISLSVGSPLCVRWKVWRLRGRISVQRLLFCVSLIRHYVSLGRMMNWSTAPTSTLCFTRKGLEVPRHGELLPNRILIFGTVLLSSLSSLNVFLCSSAGILHLSDVILNSQKFPCCSLWIHPKTFCWCGRSDSEVIIIIKKFIIMVIIILVKFWHALIMFLKLEYTRRWFSIQVSAVEAILSRIDSVKGCIFKWKACQGSDDELVWGSED